MKHILICDDELHILEGLRHLLRRGGRRITTVRSGRECLDAIATALPDLLIIDIMMPEMSGLEVVATLRAQERTRNLRTIILTAKGQAQDAAMAQEVWGAAVFAKPFSPARLRELVSATLDEVTCPE